MFKHTFNNTILRSYDIRGIYEKTLTEKDAFMLGFFFGIIVREKNPEKKLEKQDELFSKLLHIQKIVTVIQ